jgi:hypothetical protein
LKATSVEEILKAKLQTIYKDYLNLERIKQKHQQRRSSSSCDGSNTPGTVNDAGKVDAALLRWTHYV